MSTKFIKIILANLLLTIGIHLQAQQDSTCKALLRSAYNKVNLSAGQISDQKVLYLKLRIKSKINTPDGIIDQEDHVELCSGKNKMRISGEAMQVMADDHYVVTVLPKKKLIYLGLAKDNKDRLSQYLQTSTGMQKNMINNCIINSCITTSKGEKTIKLSLSKQDKEKSGIENMEYVLDSISGMLKSMKIKYAGNELIQSEVFYEKVDLNYKEMDLDGSVRNQVLNKNDQLLAKYKGYQLDDLTKANKKIK